MYDRISGTTSIPTIPAILDGIHQLISPKYRKEVMEAAQAAALRAKQEAQAKEYEALKAQVRNELLHLLDSIIFNCPKGNAILIQFEGGYRDTKNGLDSPEVSNLLQVVVDHDHWAYYHGHCLICINPDLYNRNPELILNVITLEPNPWMEARRIEGFRYLPLPKKTE